MSNYLRHNGVFITRTDDTFTVTETPPTGATIVQLGTVVTVTGGTASVPTAKTMKPIEISNWARGVVTGTYVERGPDDEDASEWPGIVRVEVCVLVDEIADRKRQKLIGTRIWAGPEDVIVAQEEAARDAG